MLFNSIHFLIFFPIVLILYFLLPKKIKKIWLLISSYYFYMCWNAKYALLILFSTLVTYICSIFISKQQNKKYKKIILISGIVLNLIVLLYFKYFNFILNSIQTLFSYININLTIPVFDIILPVGISFYTFQALGYMFDVYRDEKLVEKNFFQYALFVSFFPQLVAGPIERSKNLLKELNKPKKFNFEMARDGFLQMLWGFFLKIVIADRIAIFVDNVYGNYLQFNGWFLIIATILFAIQIYCDFYGYSTIAKGSAQILGIELMDNFNAPYLSRSIKEFWRRWHISLSSWFKDYVYIPLGGNKRGRMRGFLNILIVFFLSGLWHGAELSFVIWGLLNGIYQVFGEIFKPLKNIITSKMNKNLLYKVGEIIITFILIDFAWIFFRASNINEALEIINNILNVHNFSIFLDGTIFTAGLNLNNFILLLICIIILFIADFCKYKGIVIRKFIQKQNLLVRSLFIVFAICFILIFGIWGTAYVESNFIYFQF